ncbi:MAG: glycosyltransferase family 1 protein [Ardenticatenaceae bacterium]|nr:glycosyltransferase family 1 protein [Ardenticatenaceae bacterium]
MVHIGINAQLLTRAANYRRAGIHTFIAETLRHLPDDLGQITVFSGDPPEFLNQLPFEVTGRSWATRHPATRILWEQLVWPALASRRQIDLLHSMAFVSPVFTSIPTIVTVYDLSFLRYPQAFPRLQQRYLATQTRRSCQTAARVLAISQSGREDIHREFGVPLERIDVIYPGLGTRFQPPAEASLAAFKERYRPPERFILHVGTLQPRKNLSTLLQAVDLLDDPDLHVVLVGGKGWLYDELFAQVNRLGLSHRVHFQGYVPDEDLPCWYGAAELLAFPSIYEGFGMPIIQAMACGTPVVASNASAMPEAAGEAAVLVDPFDVEAFAEGMVSVLNNRAQAATMRAAGLRQAAKFTWAAAGQATGASYLQALNQ